MVQSSVVPRQRVSLLGATGSIGESTLKVLRLHPQRYQVYALSGHGRLDQLAALCEQYQPMMVAVPQGQGEYFLGLLQQRQMTTQPEVVEGTAGLCQIAGHPDVDVVMAAIVGAAGLVPTMTAVRAGKRVLLANKEALVMSGELLMRAARDSGALVLPVDSEHNAIFQCLPQTGGTQIQPQQGIERILLTASGGPFRTWTPEQLAAATPEQACKHPNWSMGQKISVDSATLMNKGLELIEACHLFAVPESQIMVVVHPESIIHSMVQYADGSTLAQMGRPDMCTPIANALAWPERIAAGVAPLDLFAVQSLHFEPPDELRFPCLRLAREAMQQGGTAPTVLNAANEVAVAAFLHGQIGFMDIARLIQSVITQLPMSRVDDLDTILGFDEQARQCAKRWLCDVV
ncbi:MAG: 1-deoxy-D-xylulose-5-phosphate reductoisomerase [Pseudomonadota bacterium]|nr:1-deoxy-D-xylulose-5-phosphate reductoisomerase [Pseudomonadota bacterium]